MGQTEDYCRRWTAASPAVADKSIDPDQRIVEARALMMWRRRAQWHSDRYGCVLLDD